MTRNMEDIVCDIAGFFVRPIHTAQVVIARRRFDQKMKRAIEHQTRENVDDAIRAATELHEIEPFAGVTNQCELCKVIEGISFEYMYKDYKRWHAKTSGNEGEQQAVGGPDHG